VSSVEKILPQEMKSINSCLGLMLSTFYSVHAAHGLIIVINCQSVQLLKWLVVGDNHHGWWTFTVLGWLWTCWTPYQNGHRTPL